MRPDGVVLGQIVAAVGFPDQALEIRGGQRAAEMIALIFVASGRLQKLKLGRRLHSLGDDLEPQAVCERDDGADNGCVLRTADDVIDEHPVDLELVDREAAQITHARIAGAEVVHRHQHAHGAQLFENGD